MNILKKGCFYCFDEFTSKKYLCYIKIEYKTFRNKKRKKD